MPQHKAIVQSIGGLSCFLRAGQTFVHCCFVSSLWPHEGTFRRFTLAVGNQSRKEGGCCYGPEPCIVLRSGSGRLEDHQVHTPKQFHKFSLTATAVVVVRMLHSSKAVLR